MHIVIELFFKVEKTSTNTIVNCFFCTVKSPFSKIESTKIPPK